MKLSGLQKLTLLDFPNKTAATVFTPGCDFRCPFCHNRELVSGPYPTYPPEDFFAFLETRHGLLDGVCITGGEPLMQADIGSFCQRIHDMGFAVKLDTNGSYPDALRDLVSAGLLDYVAMDVKNSPDSYARTVGIPDFNVANVNRSIEFLLKKQVPCEFRTTVVAELHDEMSLVRTARWIQDAPAWYLQEFTDSQTVMAGSGALHAFPRKKMEDLLPELREILPNTHIRGF